MTRDLGVRPWSPARRRSKLAAPSMRLSMGSLGARFSRSVISSWLTQFRAVLEDQGLCPNSCARKMASR